MKTFVRAVRSTPGHKGGGGPGGRNSPPGGVWGEAQENCFLGSFRAFIFNENGNIKAKLTNPS